MPLPPTEADRGYSRVLRIIVEDLRKEFLAAMEPAYRASLLEYQRQVLPEAMREDDAIDRVQRARERALIEWSRKWTQEELERIAERTGQLVEDVVDKSVRRQWKRVLGLDPLLPQSRLETLLKFKAQENARLITSLPDRQIAQIESGIIRFMQSGERWETLARFIEERFDVMQSQAELIARDQVGKMYSAFTHARHQELGVEEYIWQTSGDERVRDSHRAVDGKKFRYDDPPIIDGEPATPGSPINCFAGSTRVSLHNTILKVFRCSYGKEATVLTSESGRIINATANHPILTLRGWVAAHAINVGDYLIKPKRVVDSFGKEHNEYVEPTIQEVFDAVSILLPVTRTARFSGPHFHGDISPNKDVDVILVDRELMFNNIAAIFQEAVKFYFAGPNATTLGLSAQLQVLLSLFSPSDGVMRLLGELKALLASHLSHSDLISLASVSGSNSAEPEPSADRAALDAILSSYSKLTHPTLIVLHGILIQGGSIVGLESALPTDLATTSSHGNGKIVGTDIEIAAQLRQGNLTRFVDFDRVVNKGVSENFSHVYDLQTNVGWYLAEEVIVHNCRCVPIPVIPE